MDEQTSVAYLRSLVDRFREERQWHDTPKDLTASMLVEAGELMEHFRFRSDEEIERMLHQPGARQVIANEVADVLYHVLALASTIDFDLSAVFRDKMALSSGRHPAKKASVRNQQHRDMPDRAAS